MQTRDSCGEGFALGAVVEIARLAVSGIAT